MYECEGGKEGTAGRRVGGRDGESEKSVSQSI